MYYAMYVVGFALMMILNVFCYGRYNTTRARAVKYTLVTYVYGVLGAIVMGALYSHISSAHNVEEPSRVAIFGAVMFTPLLLMATVAVEKAVVKRKAPKTDGPRGKNRKKMLPPVSMRNTVDLLTPGIFIILTCAKLGCHFSGCCYGVPCEWGVHSIKAEAETVFPVQLFEVATMCVILLLCCFIKRTGFFRRGMAYPLTAAVYSVARFGWEFKRYYPEELRRLVFGLTFWQAMCCIVFTASVISLIVLYKTQPSAPLQTGKTKKPKIR